MALTGGMDVGGDTGPYNVVCLGPGTAGCRELLCVCRGREMVAGGYGEKAGLQLSEG